MKVYLVGGAVRDELLGLTPKDKDYVVVGSSVDEMLNLGYTRVGSGFPVFLHPETKEEYALARKEKKCGVGYTGFEFEWEGVSLEDDLFRRDLTINAMAKDTITGEIIDPFGGMNDLKNGILRHVSNHFVEDPLRVLRLARFLTQFPFSVHETTVALVIKIVESGELNHLTGERIWKEMSKALLSNDPQSFFEFLLAVGALHKFMPELACLKGIPQNPKYHPEGCVWTHVMMVLNNACIMSRDLSVRFSALVHDLGKGVTPKETLPAHHDHEENGLPLVERVCQRFKVEKECKKLALKVCELHLRIHKSMELRPGKLLQLLKNMEAFRNEEMFNGIMICCRADNLGKLSDHYPQALFLTVLKERMKECDIQTLVEKYQGAKLVEQIQQAQTKHIKKCANEFLNGYTTNTYM